MDEKKISINRFTPEVSQYRITEESLYDINPLILNRWSPRAFAAKEVPEQLLFSLFEAARWAPSGSNIQPWRYIIARTCEDRERFHSFISEGNREWCEQAPVLAIVISHTITPSGKPSRSHAFDAGASWAYLAIEATRKGLFAHAMGGFDRDKAREVLHIPAEYEAHAVIAIGYRGDPSDLSERNREREHPSGRRKLSETVFEGTFGSGYLV